MFFVSDTEDYMWKKWDAEESKTIEQCLKARIVKSKRWLERFDKEAEIPR